jgi:WD40 repeat protein
MIAGGQDGVLRKYTLDSAYFDIATVDTSFTLNNAPITKVLYSPGMRTLYSADNQGKFIAYDMAKEKTMPLKGTVAISAATVSIDGMSIFLVAAGSTSINQFDVFGKLINTFDGHTNDITDLLVTLDRKYLISSSKDKTIRVWDIVNAKEESKLENHTWAVTDIDIDPFSTYLVSCGLDGLVNLYDVKTRTLIRTQEFEGYKFKAVAISPDHSSIVVAGQPANVSNLAGFFKINTYIKARKIVVPPPYKVVKKVEPKPIKKDKEKQEIPPPSNPTPTPKAEVKKQGELVKKTDQVEIRIEDSNTH